MSRDPEPAPVRDYGHRWTLGYFHERRCTRCGELYADWAERYLLTVCPGRSES